MHVVIEIDDSTYEAIKNEYCILPPQKGLLKILWDAIRNGTPLPKGHGRLKDVDAFIAKVNKDRAHSCYIESWTADDVLDRLQQNYASTIIEADNI